MGKINRFKFVQEADHYLVTQMKAWLDECEGGREIKH
jgi:hypothetical protein